VVGSSLPAERPARESSQVTDDRGYDAVAPGEAIDVETTDQSIVVRQAVDGAGYVAQSVARGVDCKQRRMLPGGDETPGRSVFIERSASVTARELPDERGLSLLVSAPRR
jgi:hypothetical protein